jgi:hypothetical protein
MRDEVYLGFLSTAAEDAAALDAASDILTLTPRPSEGMPSSVYDGWLTDVEHLERGADGTVRRAETPIGFTVEFPPDYCRSIDPGLQFRVARVHVPLFHPNANAGGIVCLGPHFRPGTRMRGLVQELYAIVSGRNFASDHAFDGKAALYYLSHLDQIRSLRAKPLWRAPLAGRTRTLATAARRVDR